MKRKLFSFRMKVFFIIILFFVVLIVSELIYMINSKPSHYRDFFRKYHLKRVVRYSQLGIASKALYHFGKAAEVQMQDTTIVDSRVDWEVSFNFPGIFSESSFTREVNKILGRYSVEEYYNLHYDELARIYYLLGLSAYEAGEVELVVPFWEAAIAFGPEWSYFHIELSNYYLMLNKTLDSKAVLERCLRFSYANSYCRQYIDPSIENRSVQQIGFFEEKIVNELM